MRPQELPTPPAKGKKTWARLSRSSFQAPASPALDSTTGSPQVFEGTVAKKDAAPSSGTTFLKSLRTLIHEFDQLCAVGGTPLSDPRVTNIRDEIGKSMPRLYAMTVDETSKQTEAWKVRQFAEGSLRKFPDFDVDALRSSIAMENSVKKPRDGKKTGQSGTPKLSPGSPPATSSSSLVGIEAQPLLASWEAAVDGHGKGPAPHLRDAIRTISPEQKTMICAVKDLITHNDSTKPFASDAWYEPPAAKNPQELHRIVQAGAQPPGGQFSVQPGVQPGVPTGVPTGVPAGVPAGAPTGMQAGICTMAQTTVQTPVQARLQPTATVTLQNGVLTGLPTGVQTGRTEYARPPILVSPQPPPRMLHHLPPPFPTLHSPTVYPPISTPDFPPHHMPGQRRSISSDSVS